MHPPDALLQKRILRKVGRAVAEFRMIEEGDRILVGLSGGKDSWTLLHCLEALRRRAPISFHVEAVTVHPGFPGFRTEQLEEGCRARGFQHFVEHARIFEIVEEKRSPDTSYCAFCSRLRRGVLYGVARRRRANKIALGHHADDLIETLLLAQFFTGEIKSMPPVLQADDGVNTVIRPLCTVFESDIRSFADAEDFPVVCCGCPVCGDQGMKRKRVKRLLNQLEEEHPGIKSSVLASLGRVRRRYLMERGDEWASSKPGF